MKILNFYILDRNVIGTINSILKNKSSAIPDIRERIKRLKSIDKKKNFVATLLSSIEGAHSFNETVDDKKQTIIEESKIVKKYFKFAQNDSEVNMKLINNLYGVNLGIHEDKFINYFSFYKNISPILSQSISKTKYEEIKNLIIDTALQYTISPLHPLVLCSLAILYGNHAALRVLNYKLNPTDNHIYNALSDILTISRIPSMTIGLKTGRFKDCKIKFVTFDQHLKKIYDAFTSENSNVYTYSPQSVAVHIDITLASSLFPTLSREESYQLIEDIKAIENKKIEN